MALDFNLDSTALAAQMIDQFNRRDVDAMIASGGGQVDYTDVARAQRITDPDEFRAVMQTWVGAFSDLHGTVLSAAREGDTIAYEVRWVGTHDGPLVTPMGAIPASGRTVQGDAVFVVRLDGDRVAQVRQYSDSLTLLAQVGAIPEQATPNEAGAATPTRA